MRVHPGVILTVCLAAGFSARVPAAAQTGSLDSDLLELDAESARPADSDPPDGATTGEEPAAFERAVVPVHAAPRAAAEQVLRQAAVSPLEERLSGSSVTLLDLIAGATGRDAQRQRIAAYWRMWEAVARYNLAADHYQRLERVVAAMVEPDSTMQSAITAALADRHASKIDAVAGQYAVAALKADSADAALPLPADLPLAGRYQTHFDAIFHGERSSLPERFDAQRIDAVLPIRLAEIAARTEAVQAAVRGCDEQAERYMQLKTDQVSYLAALDQLRATRRAFLAAVLKYNLEIADYAVLIAPEGVDGAQLVPMLQKTPASDVNPATARGPQDTGPSGGSVVPATATEQKSVEQGAIELGVAGETTARGPAAAPPASKVDRTLRSVVVPSRN